MVNIMMLRWLLFWIMALALVACAEPVPEADPAEPIPEADAAEAMPGPPIIPSAVVPKSSADLHTYSGLMSLEENVLYSDVIAVVNLASSATSTASITSTHAGFTPTFWLALLEFRFTVSEYIKGSGGTNISGFVYMDYRTEAEAQAAAAAMASAHDSRWDDREAVVFLKSKNAWLRGKYPLAADQYWFGGFVYVTSDAGVNDAYTVASIHTKLWLPKKLSGTEGGAQGQSSEKTFLLDVPASAGARAQSGRASRAPADPPPESEITLTRLKSRVSALETEAKAGGTEAYYECIRVAYRVENLLRYYIIQHGKRSTIEREGAIGSGLPAGTFVVDLHRDEAPTKAAAEGTIWFEGVDEGLVRVEYVDFVAGGGGPGMFSFTRNIVTKRPLPSGVYTIQPQETWYGGKICRFPETARNLRTVTLTVTAPADTLHEAFFDPVAIGNAVGADGTNGVLDPASFAVGNATTTLSGLKWENGAATLTVSPHADLARHALDFIGLDGSVTTTLAIADATVDSAAGTYSWTAASQPWQADDKLMLRIRAVPAPPVFATTTYSFTVAENASQFDAVGQVSAVDPDGGIVTYSIVSGNGDGKFNITHNDGLIVVRRSLDYDTTSSYTLTVRATDSSGDTSTVVVNISVSAVP